MEPRGLLRGKAALITGGEGSIGMATARAFVAEGARVCLVGLVADELRDGAQALGAAATWTVADVTDSAAVKTAVAGAAEAFGGRVNTIHPGPVDNEFQHRIEVAATGASEVQAAAAFQQLIPLARHAAPAEVARAMLFLASDESSFVTGATLAVDGGMSV
jgi:NAD(P)-dependent dehydrogenase (short-subunit alcohol dehydrogenase family)